MSLERISTEGWNLAAEVDKQSFWRKVDQVEIYKGKPYRFMKGIVPKEVCEELADRMDFMQDRNYFHWGKGHGGRIGAPEWWCLHNDFHEASTKAYAKVFNLPVLPSYNFSRKYPKHAYLRHHSDREACEYSVTINLRNESNPWPFNVFDEDEMRLKSYVMEQGDAIFYHGPSCVHGRFQNTGGTVHQLFLHFVRIGGPFEGGAFEWLSEGGDPGQYERYLKLLEKSNDK